MHTRRHANANHLGQCSYHNSLSVYFPSLYTCDKRAIHRPGYEGKCPEGERRGGENNGVLIPQEGKSCQMPPLLNNSSACQECVSTFKLHRTGAGEERVTCQHTDLEMETGEVKNEGGELLLGGLQTVYVNSV